MELIAIAIMFVALLAFAGFRQLLRYHRRLMIHKERLAAMEKGVELPPFEEEARRSSWNNWNVQRLLLLAGLVWISLGVGAFVVLSAVIFAQQLPGHGSFDPIPPGLQWIGVAPVLIGVSHVIVYLVGRNKE